MSKVRDILIRELAECLSDMETGPLSDTPFALAELNDDGALELFERPGDWPVASIDLAQLVDWLIHEGWTVIR